MTRLQPFFHFSKLERLQRPVSGLSAANRALSTSADGETCQVTSCTLASNARYGFGPMLAYLAAYSVFVCAELADPAAVIISIRTPLVYARHTTRSELQWCLIGHHSVYGPPSKARVETNGT